MIQIIPSIAILEGKVVRLESGDYDISDTQFLWEDIDTATRFENARMV